MTDLEKELECAICRGTLCDPRVLDCQHCFCLKCLFRVTDRDESSGVEVKCCLGCEGATVPPEDIRSLKKNHVIGSLCHQLRDKQFSKGLVECDWCGAEGLALGYKQEAVAGLTNAELEERKRCMISKCLHCTAFFCEKCENDTTCDHEFLCHVPCPGIQPKPITLYPYFTVEDAIDGLHNCLEKEMKYKVVPHVLSAELKYATFYRCEANCKGKKGGREIKQRLTVFAPSADLEDGFHSSQLSRTMTIRPPWHSMELSLMHEIRTVLGASTEMYYTLTRLLKRMLPALRISVTEEEYSWCGSIAHAIKSIHVIDTVVIRRMCMRLQLVATVLGYTELEKLQATIPGEQSAKKRRELQRHAEVLQSMSNISTTSIKRGGVVVSDAADEFVRVLAEFGDAVSDRMKKGCTKPRQCGSLLSLNELVGAVLECASQLTQRKLNLSKLYKETVGDFLAGSNALNEETKSRLLCEEQSLHNAAFALESLVGFEAQARLLWSRCHASFGTHSDVDCDLTSATVAACKQTDAKMEMSKHTQEVSAIVETLLPQINNIREQHLELLQNNPNEIQQHRILQTQLSTLLVQTLELFQKEHSLGLRDAYETQLTGGFVYAHNFLEVLQTEGYPEVAPLDAELSRDPTALFDAFGQNTRQVVADLRRHASHYPSHTKLYHLLRSCFGSEVAPKIPEGAFLGHVSSSAAAMTPPTPSTNSVQCQTGGVSDATSRSSSTSSGCDVLPPEEEEAQCTVRCSIVEEGLRAPLVGSGVLLPEARDEAIETAKQHFKKEFSGMSDVTVSLSSKSPQPVLVPFFTGEYTIDGESRDYHWMCMAQMVADHVVELPPLRGLRKVADGVSWYLSSPIAWFATHFVLVSSYSVGRQAIKLASWIKQQQQ